MDHKTDHSKVSVNKGKSGRLPDFVGGKDPEVVLPLSCVGLNRKKKEINYERRKTEYHVKYSE